MLSYLMILLIVVTSLPVVRRRSYNTFYYTHIICSSLIFVLTSIHASTDFYFLLPGLLLWILDWMYRLFLGKEGGLRKNVTGTLEVAEGGWYRLTYPVAVRSSIYSNSNLENQAYDDHPLQTYHVNIPSVSRIQSHAFTAAKIGSRTSGPVILFQRAPARSAKTKQEKVAKEWTWKLGSVAGSIPEVTANELHADHPARVDIPCRLEGPYIPREVQEFQDADKIICIVGGTGITGAYSLAECWLENRAQSSNAQFVLFWTVRHRESACLSEWQNLEQHVSGTNNIRLKLHVSLESGKLNIAQALRTELTSSDLTGEQAVPDSRAWVYASGQEGYWTGLKMSALTWSGN